MENVVSELFEGAISVKSILEAGKRRPCRLYVDGKKRSRDFAYILALARKNGVDVQITDRETLSQLSGSERHGGILLEAEKREFERPAVLPHGFLCYVNGVEDPYNIGSICRTLYAAGCQGLLLDRRDWSSAEKIILRASAGAYERLDIWMYDSEKDLLADLKSRKIPLICADRKDACSLVKYTYPDDFCLAVGGALRGLSATMEQASSQNIYIEYGRDFRNALDSASAVAVFAFEYVRQKAGGMNEAE